MSDTWSLMKEQNEIKYNLFKRLNEHYNALNKGDYFLIDKESLIPNIYPISLLLCENIDLNMKKSNELLFDYNKYKWLIDVYLSTNARNYLQNSIDYSKRSENFLDTHYAPLFSFKLTKFSNNNDVDKLNLLKLNFVSQTEFHKIILWSNDASSYVSKVDNSEYLTKKNRSVTANDQFLSNANASLIELIHRIDDINSIISMLSFKIQK